VLINQQLQDLITKEFKELIKQGTSEKDAACKIVNRYEREAGSWLLVINLILKLLKP